jgi:predicted metallopeptidase
MNQRRSGAQPFNYTNALWAVVRDVVATLEEFRHVELDRVLLSIAQARQATRHGSYASCAPLRFAGGARERVIRRRRYRMPELRHEGREILYILYFMLPRFHEEQDYREKLATVIHELYHISPRFNGDIRRFPGRNFAHGESRETYHAAMRVLADRYLATSPRAADHTFLKVPFAELLKHPGGVVGMSVPRPRAQLVRE